ncbi:MAG: thiamine diphosphokinase [Rhodobacteraceae bacterium]|jgi:thiamine pyrophosphokinase|nr:thiamine diphosphokinase [Paracoccaceae bacterium]
MNQAIVQSHDGVTLVGGGPVSRADLARAQALAPVVVAADGGADRCLRAGVMPQAVIGDFDSISAGARAAIAADRLHVIAEQNSTDFDKALRSVAAPFVLALGFAGGRIDHELAVLGTLVRRDAPCVLVGPQDVVFHCASSCRLDMQPGARLSLFPMARVRGQSQGLEWPIAGLNMAPDGQIGTSNRVVARAVELVFDAPGMLVILPKRYLPQAIAAVRQSWRGGHGR